MEHFSFSAIIAWNIWCFFTDYSGKALKVNNSEGCHGILTAPKHISFKTPMSFFLQIIRKPKEGREAIPEPSPPIRIIIMHKIINFVRNMECRSLLSHKYLHLILQYKIMEYLKQCKSCTLFECEGHVWMPLVLCTYNSDKVLQIFLSSSVCLYIGDNACAEYIIGDSCFINQCS